LKKIYNQARKVTSKAEFIEWELSGYNPGTDRTPISITEIKDKCIGLRELVADLIDMLGGRINDEIF